MLHDMLISDILHTRTYNMTRYMQLGPAYSTVCGYSPSSLTTPQTPIQTVIADFNTRLNSSVSLVHRGRPELSAWNGMHHRGSGGGGGGDGAVVDSGGGGGAGMAAASSGVSRVRDRSSRALTAPTSARLRSGRPAAASHTTLRRVTAWAKRRCSGWLSSTLYALHCSRKWPIRGWSFISPSYGKMYRPCASTAFAQNSRTVVQRAVFSALERTCRASASL